MFMTKIYLRNIRSDFEKPENPESTKCLNKLCCAAVINLGSLIMTLNEFTIDSEVLNPGAVALWNTVQ